MVWQPVGHTNALRHDLALLSLVATRSLAAVWASPAMPLHLTLMWPLQQAVLVGNLLHAAACLPALRKLLTFLVRR
jgi:hypothetical protein